MLGERRHTANLDLLLLLLRGLVLWGCITMQLNLMLMFKPRALTEPWVSLHLDYACLVGVREPDSFLTTLASVLLNVLSRHVLCGWLSVRHGQLCSALKARTSRDAAVKPFKLSVSHYLDLPELERWLKEWRDSLLSDAGVNWDSGRGGAQILPVFIFDVPSTGWKAWHLRQLCIGSALHWH